MGSRERTRAYLWKGHKSNHCRLGSPGHTTGSPGWIVVGIWPGSEPEFMVPLYGLHERFLLTLARTEEGPRLTPLVAFGTFSQLPERRS